MDFEGYKGLYTEDVLRSIRFQNGETTYTKGRDKGTQNTVNRLKMLTARAQVSDDEVKGKVSMIIANQHKEEESPRWSSTGLADLVFRRTEAGWKIAEFHVHLDRPDPRPSNRI